MKIYKYPLVIEDEQNISMPLGAELLTVELQHGRPCLWAIVDEEQPNTEDRKLLIIGTGNPMPKVGKYLATFQSMGNGGFSFVWHVFEAPNE